MIRIACKSETLIRKIGALLVHVMVVLLSTSILFAQVEKAEIDSTSIQKERADSVLINLLDKLTKQDPIKQRISNDIEISELIINSMISKHGNDFFDFFTSSFSWPQSNENFIILISEKPFRANTTQILIKVNDLEVFQNVLQPRTSYLEELALYAQGITKQYIVNYQQIMHDLEGDDRSGSGIY